MEKKKKKKKKKKKTTGKGKKVERERERARGYQVNVLLIFNSYPTFWLQKPVEKCLKKALNIIMHANILKDYAKNTNTSIILANNALMFEH